MSAQSQPNCMYSLEFKLHVCYYLKYTNPCPRETAIQFNISALKVLMWIRYEDYYEQLWGLGVRVEAESDQ